MRRAKLHKKIVNIRTDFLHKVTTTIAKNHSVVVLEDLKIQNMMRSASGTVEKPGKNVAQKSGLNKAIQRQGWGLFDVMISYKLSRDGGILLKVYPHYSSCTCSICGHVNKESRVSRDHFVCSACAHEKHADVNAAEVIHTRGLRELCQSLLSHACQNGEVKSSLFLQEPSLLGD